MDRVEATLQVAPNRGTLLEHGNKNAAVKSFIVLAPGFSAIFTFVRLVLPQKEIIFYYISLNSDLGSDEHLGARSSDQIELLSCFLLHLILGARVKHFRLKTSQIEPQPAQAWTVKLLNNRDEISFAKLASNFILASWMVTLGFFVDRIRRMNVDDADSESGGFFLFCFPFLADCSAGLVISVVYFLKHQKLRNRIVKEIRQEANITLNV